MSDVWKYYQFSNLVRRLELRKVYMIRFDRDVEYIIVNIYFMLLYLNRSRVGTHYDVVE